MKLQRTLPLLLLLALLAGCGTSSQPSALTAEERTQLYQTAIESARDAEMNEAIGILTDTGDDMADVIFELLGVTAADMSAFALSVSPMNIKAYGIAAIYPPLGSRTPYWRVSTPSSTGRSRALSSIWRISMKSPATPVWRLWRTAPSCWLCARTRTRCLTPSETRSRAQPEPKSRLIQPEREPWRFPFTLSFPPKPLAGEFSTA